MIGTVRQAPISAAHARSTAPQAATVERWPLLVTASHGLRFPTRRAHRMARTRHRPCDQNRRSVPWRESTPSRARSAARPRTGRWTAKVNRYGSPANMSTGLVAPAGAPSDTAPAASGAAQPRRCCAPPEGEAPQHRTSRRRHTGTSFFPARALMARPSAATTRRNADHLSRTHRPLGHPIHWDDSAPIPRHEGPRDRHDRRGG